MAKAKSKPEELKKYKDYVKKSLSELTPILQKAAVGDFTEGIEIPKEENEFSELFVGLSLMMEDLREMGRARKKTEEEGERTKTERQKRLSELERWRKLTTERELRMVELKKEISALEEEVKRLKGD